VRVAVPADGTAIGEAHGAAWEQAYQDLFDPAVVARAAAGRRRGWPHAIQPLLAEDGLLLVGELNGTVVAFAHAGPAQARPALAEIYGFYSHPAAWGSGIASLLQGEICARLADRWTRVVLWTHRDAGRARRFYEKSGFALTGGQKIETYSDWIGDAAVQAPVVEYGKTLADGPTRSRKPRR
jgi:GNAT superfamily N-acetyltransferase